MKTINFFISEFLRKNKDDLLGLLFNKYPQFIYKSLNKLPIGEIPVFTFHDVNPIKFEEQILFLAENNYKSLSSTEFYEIMTGKKESVENAIVLTFDDGHHSLWSFAFPILKRYDMKAISFLIPDKIKDDNTRYPNLENVFLDESALVDIKKREKVNPFCTWQEIHKIHKSKIIDFQSHSLHHQSIFINNRIMNFVAPSSSFSVLSSSLVPVIHKNGSDSYPERIEPGYPLFQWAPAMSGEKRFIENEEFVNACINFVNNSGEEFFTKKNWRYELFQFAKNAEKSGILFGRYQSKAEQYNDILKNLKESKKIIEQRINAEVNHLCYPYFRGSNTSLRASKEAGYITNYWGLIGKKFINSPGQDPFRIARIEADYIFTLPGKNRRSLLELLSKKIKNRLFSNEIFSIKEKF